VKTAKKDAYSVLCHLTLYVKETSSGAETPSSAIGVFSWFVTLANMIYNIAISKYITMHALSNSMLHQ